MTLALLSLGFAAPLQAATVTTFTTRAAFDAAVGASTLEDFNDIVDDILFTAAPVDVGAFTLSATPGSFDSNRVDAAPFDLGSSVIDGTTLVNVINSPGNSLYLTFDSPVTAFGADFRSINDRFDRTRILVGSDVLTLPILDFAALSFFGFLSDTPFTVVQLYSFNPDGYAMDNVSFSSAATPVPEPTSIVLLAGGLAGVLFRGRRRAS